MNISDSIFKAYDIRGIYPREINEESIVPITEAIYHFFEEQLNKSSLTIVVGRDMRLSSPSLFNVAKSTLINCGATIIDVGLVSTPTFYFAVLDGKYDAGIQISASHNPKEYNGIKFVKRVGNQLLKIGKDTGMEDVKEKALRGVGNHSQQTGSVITIEDSAQKEILSALEGINREQIKKFKIVADPANAMGILYLEELFKHIPGELIRMNFTLDGNFPAHQPDPLQFDTLESLQRKVLEEKADLGIAPDGDGDRVFFINEKGEIIPATLITSLLAKNVLTKSPGGKIIADIRDIMNVRNVCRKYNGKFLISKVGHALITEQVNREGAAFAGESSGHFYFKETGGAESSVRVILYLLDAMSKSGKPVSELLEEFHTAYESGEYNFVLPATVPAKSILDVFATKYSDGSISWLDGLSVDYPKWRFNIRTSNTEPLLRLNVEASDPATLKKHLDQLLSELEKNKASRK